jgi:two-component system OmpR family response regulator
MAKKILVIDDDPHLRTSVAFSMEKAGFAVVEAQDGVEGLELFKKHATDLIILDVMMPKLDGTETCREIRKASNVPIVFLTSAGEEIDRIVGLEMGADDYITKPFSPRELVARVKAIFRRVDQLTQKKTSVEQTDPTQILKIGRIVIDLEQCMVLLDGKEIAMTAVELKLLSSFARRPKKVFERDSIMTHAYGDNVVVSDRTIDSHIRKIRQKFAEFGVDPIETVHGIGYKLSSTLLD